MRTIKDYIVLSLKGVAMGAADVVPGVSGGTIAFISGVYEELLNTISSVNLQALKTLKNDGLKAAWSHINGNFLVALFLGMGISFVSLAKAVTYFLEYHPIQLWSFFFGLVLASIIYVGKQVEKWDVLSIVGLITGGVVAYFITVLPPLGDTSASWYVFVSGLIAICAMILPGISGSFILVILGSYKTVMGAITDKDIKILAIFAGGCIVGLLAFSRVLKWLFNNFKNVTIAILTGFLIGSLNKIWPWKETKEFIIDRHGDVLPTVQENLLPGSFAGDNHLMVSILCCIGGAAIIFLMEFAANKLKSK